MNAGRPGGASAILDVLGEDSARLHSEIRRYVEGPVGDGSVGVCEGVFDVAGSRFRFFTRLARPIVGPQLLISRLERDVPFRVVNRFSRSVAGAPELRAERVFRFRGGEEYFADLLRPTANGRALHNVLGPAGRIELRLRCEVTDDGHLWLRSDGSWLCLGGLRIRLPGFLAVNAEVENGYDATRSQQTVRARASNPLLGTIIEYRGSFLYRLE